MQISQSLEPRTEYELQAMREGQANARARAMDCSIHTPMNKEAVIKAMFGDSYMPLTDTDIAKLEAEQSAIDREQQAQFIESQYCNSGVPKKFHNVELVKLFASGQVNATDKNKKQLTKARVDTFITNVAEGRPQAMWMCGVAGTGKTALSCAIMHELVRRGVKCKYFKSHEIMARLDDARNRVSKETRTSIMADVTGCTLVVIDEVARWPSPEWEKFMLFSLVDSNYDAFRSAIYIGNEEKKKFAEFIGKAATDRFKGMSIALDFGGKSLRGTMGELYKL